MKSSGKWLERAWLCLSLLMALVLLCSASRPQPKPPDANAAQPNAEPSKDPLGRDTPRGAVLGFLSAARKGNAEISVLYLNTSQRGEAAQTLARQLAVVLDRGLPARLNQLSDNPEGSIPDPLKPDEDLVGTITTSKGDLDIRVERVDRGKLGRVWLFSRETLNSIPDAFQEVSTPAVEQVLPQWLINTRVANIQLFQWLAVFVGIPLIYVSIGLLNKGASLGVGAARRHLLRNANAHNPKILPPPVRLLILAAIIRWLLWTVGLSLLARQFWSTTVTVISIVASVWLLILVNGWCERAYLRHLRSRNLSGAASLLRLGRRVIDLLILFAGLLFTLRHFAVNLATALAGLGIGGIAVALAAQKTLENVISGISLILDQALRAGDTLKFGDILGTVEDVGLRSTRIRTLDRTVVSVPNSQIAAMSIETLSARDKFWFHHLVSLRYETTPQQMRFVVGGIQDLLAQHSGVEAESARVRFLGLGTSSITVEIFAYVLDRDWNHFLETQEALLLLVMDTIREAGAEIGFPAQAVYLPAERLPLERTPAGDARLPRSA